MNLLKLLFIVDDSHGAVLLFVIATPVSKSSDVILQIAFFQNADLRLDFAKNFLLRCSDYCPP